MWRLPSAMKGGGGGGLRANDIFVRPVVSRLTKLFCDRSISGQDAEAIFLTVGCP